MSDSLSRSNVVPFRRRPAGVCARLVRVEYSVEGRPESALTTLEERDEFIARLLATRSYVTDLVSTPSRPQRQPKLTRSTRPTHDDTPPRSAA